MKQLPALIARAKVLAASAVTWLLAAATIITLAAGELAKVFPDNAATIGALAIRAVAFTGGAVAIIRRVTPVLDQARGLLPADPLTLTTAREVELHDRAERYAVETIVATNPGIDADKVRRMRAASDPHRRA